MVVEVLTGYACKAQWSVLMISAEAAVMSKMRRLSFIYWVHDLLFVKGETSFLSAYYTNDLDELARNDIESHSFGSFQWFRN